MADNSTLPATGDVIASKDVAGVKHQKVLAEFDISGTPTLVSSSNPLPVTVVSGGDGSIQGVDAHDAALTADPVTVGGYAKAAAPTDVSADGDAVRAWFLRNGAQCVQQTASGTLLAAGNGTNGAALRVTLASDSTGIVGATCSGPLAHDAVATSSNPVLNGGYASAAAPTDVSTDGDAVRFWTLRNGAQCVNLTAAGTLIGAGNGTAATAIRVTLASDSTGTTACTSSTAANFNVRADHTLVDNAGFTDGTTRVGLAGFIFDEVAGTSLTENDAAAARIDSKRAQVMVVEDATTRGQRQAVSSAGAAKVEGGAAHGASVAGAPMLAGLEGRTAVGTAVTSGQAVRALGDVFGKQVVLLGALHEEQANGLANFTNTTAADIIAAAGAGVKIAVTSVLVINGHATVGTKVSIRDGTTAKITGYAAAAGGGFAHNSGGRPLFIGTANAAITAICGTTGADVDVSISGYLIKN